MIGIIGGSGFYELEGFNVQNLREILTPFGFPSGSYVIGELSDREVVFLPRHGLEHNIPPHKINYRANVWGFRELGVERLVSVGAVGGISHRMVPGKVVLLDQIIDMTKARDSTFFDGADGADSVVHIDFTEPFCPELRQALWEAGEKTEIEFEGAGTYICVNGPRLETRAEIRMFAMLGADVVGMTAMPEASLAREAEICYAGVSVVTNYAAGIMKKKLTTTEVKDVIRGTTHVLKELLKGALKLIPAERKCACKEALQEAKM
ncbi:MAG: S-methyl-5'-thioadenosine phosphorylase [Nitrospirota bacterium]